MLLWYSAFCEMCWTCFSCSYLWHCCYFIRHWKLTLLSDDYAFSQLCHQTYNMLLIPSSYTFGLSQLASCNDKKTRHTVNNARKVEKKTTHNFHEQWEEEFFTKKENCVCLICGATVATVKWHNIERHFSTCHKTFNASYLPGSSLQVEKAYELKAALGKKLFSFFTEKVPSSNGGFV